MAKELILSGVVQGVCCRDYCRQLARKIGVRGSATNLSDGTVRVLLDTDDEALTDKYVGFLTSNPYGIRFYGEITNVHVGEYSGRISGDYMF